MSPADVVPSFLIAALLGFLMGLEREQKRETWGSIFAGVRTFPLIAIFGAASGQIALATNSMIIFVAFLTIGSLLLLSYWRASSGEKIGGTTEVAALVAFTLGVLSGLGQHVAALAGAVIATGILTSRVRLRHLVETLSQEDMFAIVQFAAVSLVILPLVPNQSFGPWGVWNPRSIWFMVVLISGISFVGYLLSKVISMEKGIGLSGFIGGIASSTAVTLSFSERSKSNISISRMFAAGAMAATAVSIIRLLIIIGVLEPQLIPDILVPYLAYFVVTALGGFVIYRLSYQEKVEGAQISNPFELKTALIFALVFAGILFITKAAEIFFGSKGVFLASAIAGLTQEDAITLTLAKQVGEGLKTDIAAKGLALSLVGNSAFKTFLAFSLGSRKYAINVAIVMFLASVAILVAAWYTPSAWLEPIRSFITTQL